MIRRVFAAMAVFTVLAGGISGSRSAGARPAGSKNGTAGDLKQQLQELIREGDSVKADRTATDAESASLAKEEERLIATADLVQGGVRTNKADRDSSNRKWVSTQRRSQGTRAIAARIPKGILKCALLTTEKPES